MSGDEMFRAPAEAYDRFVGRYGGALAEALVAFAGLPRGASALDVGCGTGALTSLLVARAGGAPVAGVDPSEPFVAACRTRVPGAEVVVGGAERLPFPDGTFDAALSQLVLTFLADAPAGVREMARVTRPGGVVAAAVWDYAEGMTLLRAFWDAAREVVAQAADSDEGVTMHPGSPAELQELWHGAGLGSVRTGALSASAAYAGFDDLWAPLPSGVGPAGAFVAALDDDDRAALRALLRRRLGVGGEPFSLTARAWAVCGVAA